jgi:small-conductance mechanosensitive channel
MTLGPLEQWFHAPLAHLSSGSLSLESLLKALGVAVVALLAGFVLSRTIRTLLLARGVAAGVAFAASKVTRYVFALLGIAVAIESLGFSLTALLTASSALLLGVGLGLQDIARNVLAGVLLLVEQPVRKGDFIKVGDAYGVIADIGLRATKVVTRDEVVMIVPNHLLTSAVVVNHSVPTTHVRIRVQVGAVYGSDVALVQRVLLGVADGHGGVLKAPAPEVRLEAFDPGLAFSLLVWIENPRSDLRIESDLRFAIEAAFREAKLEMPVATTPAG